MGKFCYIKRIAKRTCLITLDHLHNHLKKKSQCLPPQHHLTPRSLPQDLLGRVVAIDVCLQHSALQTNIKIVILYYWTAEWVR